MLIADWPETEVRNWASVPAVMSAFQAVTVAVSCVPVILAKLSGSAAIAVARVLRSGALVIQPLAISALLSELQV